jgi:manganese/zinc/iron transport system permease protein
MNSLTDTAVAWPTLDALLRVLTLDDYNTRVVVIGTVLLGIAAGVIGTFMLLRKRSLMGDAVSHATLPGIGIAFLIMVAAGGTGRELPGLLAGATVSGLLGMGAVLLIRAQSRLKEDAALGIVLSVFFGLGVAILGIIQQLKQGSAAGLESFIYGKTASMLARDAWLIGGAALAVTIGCTLLFKEFAIVCFDAEYARAQGWRVWMLDVLMMVLVVLVTVIGLQAVGLILMIALLITPAAAARFWTERLGHTVLLAGVIGGVSGFLGAGLSALLPRMPAGAIIVVVAGVVFLISMVAGTSRGLVRRALIHLGLVRNVQRQHLLRALYEWYEQEGLPVDAAPATASGLPAVPVAHLHGARSWTLAAVTRVVGRLRRGGLIARAPGDGIRLTPAGWDAARRQVRNHRLWEIYLMAYADVAAVHVDRNADAIEHVLGTEMVTRLEALLANEHPERVVPASPH